jgi:SAM-dependent methyltransferase
MRRISGLATVGDVESGDVTAFLDSHQEFYRAYAATARLVAPRLPAAIHADPASNMTRPWEWAYVCRCMADEPVPEVIDVGSGAGFLPFLLSSQGVDVTAVDIEPRLAGIVQRLNSELGTRVRFAEGNAERLSLDKTAAGAVLSVSVLEHVDDPVAALRSMRGLVDKGRPGILTFDVALGSEGGVKIPVLLDLLQEMRTSWETVYPEGWELRPDLYTTEYVRKTHPERLPWRRFSYSPGNILAGVAGKTPFRSLAFAAVFLRAR